MHNEDNKRGITEAERKLMDRVVMFGSDAYPIEKLGRQWIWRECCGVPAGPQLYKTKREATRAFETFMDILLDAKAGRI